MILKKPAYAGFFDKAWKKSQMQQFLFICLVLITTLSYAEKKFEIPRSSIIELEDPVTNRTYPLFIKLPKSYKNNVKKKE